MRINELLTEDQTDEGVWDQVKGAAKGAWSGMKQGWAAGKTPEEPATGGTEPTLDTQPAAGGTAPAGDGRPYVAPAPAAARTAPGAATTAPAPSTAGNVGDIMKAIDKLDRPGKQQVASELKKSIAGGGKPAPAGMPAQGSPVAAPKPAAGAFGQMASQLGAMAPPDQSSTGGTTQQTATGQVHTASPTNPNQPPVAAPAAAAPEAPAAAPEAPAAEPVVPAAATPPPVRTGGKVAGQVSQTPNAIRKRDARAAATAPVAEFHSNFLGRMI